MRKFAAIFIFVYLAACSTGEVVIPASTADSPHISTPITTQVSLPATDTPAPTSTPTAVPTAIGGGAGKIAFTSEQDGYPEIYVINADGSGLIKLANNITPKYEPSWSPDGKKIAFGTNDNESASLYVMNADGSNPVKLIDTNDISTYDSATSDWRFEVSPLWSPDGTRIAFEVSYYIGCCSSNGYIHLVNADGSGLVGSTAIPIWERFTWSPDSKKITLGSSCGGWGICVMNADGTNLTNLTKSSSIDTRPIWSPDGQRIAFGSNRNGTRDIFVMNADGTNMVDLTNNNNATDSSPVWSPDGEKIVFTAVWDDGSAIFVMNADGTNLINLTSTHPAGGRNMVWSPDGTKIAFVSDIDDTSEIYVVDADGSNVVRLTNNDVNDNSPVWSP